MQRNKLLRTAVGFLRRAIPSPIRVWLKQFRPGVVKDLVWPVIRYYRKSPNRDQYSEEVDFLRRYGYSFFPYAFVRKYHATSVIVTRDDNCGLSYVMHDGRRMYFPADMDDDYIKAYYNQIRIDQDPESPHRYLDSDFSVFAGAVIADVGAAEGVFCLDNIEIASHCYLFEPDSRWQEPLHQTFAPWSAKVTIEKLLVGANEGPGETTVDRYFDGKSLDFLKMDAEGAEPEILKGAASTLTQKVRRAAVCCYHKAEHYTVLERQLRELGFNTRHSQGWMLVPTTFDPHQFPPYFRRALLKAQREI